MSMRRRGAHQGGMWVATHELPKSPGHVFAPPILLRLKMEINSREHFSVYGFTRVPFAVSSRWFEGRCEVCSYELDELLGTKLRALYQRKQGREGPGVHRRHWPSARGRLRLGHRNGGPGRLIPPDRASAGGSLEGWRVVVS